MNIQEQEDMEYEMNAQYDHEREKHAGMALDNKYEAYCDQLDMENEINFKRKRKKYNG